MAFYYLEDPPLNQWNTYSPPVAFYESSSSSSSDLSYQYIQPPVNPIVQGSQNISGIPTSSGVQCLWETTDGTICNRWCQSPDELASHITNTHISCKGKFVCHWKGCDLQGKLFKAKYKIVNHLRVHTGERPFECDVCGKRFARAEYRVNHRRIHTGEKPFLCLVEGCSKRYRTSSALIKHQKTHLEPTPYGCKQCDKQYTCPSSLRKHIRNHHEKESTETSVSGQSSTDNSNALISPAPDYHNQANIPGCPQVAYSGFNDHRYQTDQYPYNNYASSVRQVGYQSSTNHSQQDFSGPYDFHQRSYNYFPY